MDLDPNLSSQWCLTQQSGFLWIIAHDNQKLWKGVGLAPGAAKDIYSGHAKAIGLLAALLFLMHYIESYSKADFTNTSFNCFCDNISVITWSTEKINAPWMYPNDAITDDNDLYSVLASTIRCCAPANLQFLHVQGHQDTKANRPLTIVKQLNVECDQQAKTYVLTTKSSSVAFGNPNIPEARPNIRIQGKIVCWKLLPALRSTLSAPAYCTYLKTKLNWTNNDIQDINWPVLQSALDTFPSNDQHQLLLFINNKLPLQASKAHPHLGLKLCPSCQHDDEDLWHFLECTHSDWTKLFRELCNNLNQITQKLCLHPCLQTSIWLGLLAIMHDTSYPDIDIDLLLPLRHPVQKQIRLGWDQLYQKNDL